MINLVAGFTLAISIFGFCVLSIAAHETNDEINRSWFLCGVTLSIIGIGVAIIIFTKF